MSRIIDSAMSLEEALAGKDIPADIRDSLALLDIIHLSLDGLAHQGQLVVHKKIADEVAGIFEALFAAEFPIEKMIPIVDYDWSDDRSMADNNSSAFNHRFIYGTERLSNHSYGLAIDINPRINPYHAADGSILPLGSVYDPARPGTLVAEREIVALFEGRGWEWGGRWDRPDWQHFQKLN